MNSLDPLSLFLPPVQTWFRRSMGQPTPAQFQGWPAIAAGQNTLILAPTGSGKTLAAFMACLDWLWRTLPVEENPPSKGDLGIRVLYISPLKALNNDIYRNLQVPLAGVAECAAEMQFPLAPIEIAVRTGDTPTAERQKLLRHPPHVLITTPESLHILLTSKARDTLRNVRYCIVDEIHALCPNKRGVFLSLLLERLEALNPSSFIRIGLSATQRPLHEVARYLGGLIHHPEGTFSPRPVTIIDTGLRKDLDLQVLSPVPQFGPLPEKSIWPSIYRLLGDLIQQHRSTIIFANNRRSVERITSQLNSGLESVASDQLPATKEPDNSQDNSSLTTDHWPLATVRAHHGSVALEVRQETERALKEGRLRAVVATASLELGIDMGAVDLVCQVESPGNVARALQRVGRAGHLVGQQSKGRLIPKTQGDLLEQAVLAAEMVAGNVEELRVPANCLDVLAQQIVAMVAMEDWDVPALFIRVRQTYPFHDLTAHAFEIVLEMVTGRYRFHEMLDDLPPKPAGESSNLRGGSARRHTLTALQPRISWDRVHNRLHALPGSQRLAIVHGGTIPDTGQYAVYTKGIRLGELDEEFIYERRIGDTFLLGTNAWRLEKIETDRIQVSPAEGTPAMVPFWRGEQTGRSFDLGVAQGRFLRELSTRLNDTDCLKWLETHFHLDAAAARNLRTFVRRQLDKTGCLPSEQTIVVEASRDQLGDWQIVVLSLFGGRLNFSLRLALENLLRQRLGYRPQCLHHDDGILIRLTETDEPVMDLFAGLTPENVQSLVLDELADSALFALRFRQNASRALLLPPGQPGKRAPLWLQRLRGRDLLQVARRHADFPIVVETFRECLHDHLELPRLQSLLADMQSGKVQVVTCRLETPSAFANELLFAFTAAFMYQYDDTESEPSGGYTRLDQQLLDQLIPGQTRLDPRAIQQVDRRLRGLGLPPRSLTEMAEWLRKLGDLTPGELEGPMLGFLQTLAEEGRATRIELPACREPTRWVLTEEVDHYRKVFGLSPADAEDRRLHGEKILSRFLETHALVGLHDVLDRYPFDPDWAKGKLEEWTDKGRLRHVPPARDTEPLQWSAPANLEQIQRGTLGLLRREVISVPATRFADFVMHWQGVIAPSPLWGESQGPDRLEEVLTRLQSLLLPADLWEQTLLPARLAGYQPRWLDDALSSGQWLWYCQGEQETGAGLLAFANRENLSRMTLPSSTPPSLPENAEKILNLLQARGALYVSDLAQDTGFSPSVVRIALWSLLRQSLVINDRYDVIRKGQEKTASVGQTATLSARNRSPRYVSPLRPARSSTRTPRHSASEGRWSLLPWGSPEMEGRVIFQAHVLLQRYGIVARELALLDPLMPPWRVLYEVLGRLELAGEVRRGYFVEGLSGAQFALPEAVRELQDLGSPSQARAPVLLVHSLDPANLYGAGAPFDISLLEEGTRPFLRRAGNWLAIRAGRPILLIENQGRRLTSLSSATREEIAAAVACMPRILQADHSLENRHKLTVEEWNDKLVSGTEGRELLEAAGFVRDYQSMTLYRHS